MFNRSANAAQLSIDIAQHLAQIALDVAGFAPVPGLAPAATLVLTIINLCNSVSVNRKEAELLARRCASLLPILRDGTQGMEPDMVEKQAQDVCCVLQGIQNNFEAWTKLDLFDKILNRSEISATIKQNNMDIDRCLQNLMTAAALASNKWQQEAERAREADRVDILTSIHSLNGQVATKQQINELLRQGNVNMDKLVEFMGLVQSRLQVAPEEELSSLQQMLGDLLSETGHLPPGIRLAGNGKEVRKIKQFPNKIGYHYDIYEGEYIGKVKVALKVLRGVRSEEAHVQYFIRESLLWRQIGEQDGGKHIVPFIGIVTDDGPYPYMVSPWQHNGNSLAWVRRIDLDINVVDLIRKIANGIQVLHTWQGSGIVHGDIRAENILISDQGNPLISDFSLAKILDSLPGVPRTHSVGVTESYRWTAPEVSGENPTMSSKSDIFSLAMTMLELLTGEQPFAEVRHNTAVLFKIQKGQRPKRPTHKPINDDIWELLQHCWAANPDERPQIQQVVAILDAMH